MNTIKAVLLLSAFTVTWAITAAAEPPRARLVLSVPTVRIEPAQDGAPGYRVLEFPARLTNTSERPIYYHGWSREMPNVQEYLRTPGGTWKGEIFIGCGMDYQFRNAFQELAPGASVTFSVSAFPGSIRRQFRIELPIFDAPNEAAPQARLKSGESFMIRAAVPAGR